MTASDTKYNWSGITYEELTPAQKSFLMKVIQNPDKSFFLRGCAGSGKTVLASHALSILRKNQNKQAGLLVYTKLLKKFIQDGFGDNGIAADITHFHHWYYRGKSRKDIFLIDECQDFKPEWINAVITHSASQIWLGDENQQLYNEDNQGPAFRALLSKFDESHIETLDVNYRNSPFVARFASKFIQLTEIDEANGITIESKIEAFMKPILRNTGKTSKAVNQPVVLIHGENKMREIDAMAEIIKSIRSNKQLQSKRIAIGHLLHERLNVLESEFRKRGINPYRVNKEKLELPDFKAPDSLIISPIHSLKGLEFDYIFFPWSEEDQWNDIQTYNNLLFVLFTRAKSRVYCSFSNPANSPVYQAVKDDKEAEYYQLLPASDILKNGNPVKPEKDIDKIIKKHFDEFNI